MIDQSVLESILDRKMLFQKIDTTEGPTLQVVEVTKMFFARSNYWIHWLERQGRIVWEGEPLEARREERGEHGEARIYDIADVEKLVYALADEGVIDERQRVSALVTLVGLAAVWEYI